jgi:DNA (cytosine-5)-methyltransferase 1
MSDQSRASAFHVLRWCEALDVSDVLLENVPEFMDWGPLYNDCNCGAGTDKEMKLHDKKCHWNKPIPKMKGRVYRSFLSSMRALGYKVEARVINTADYGDPQTRKRLFIMARKNKRIIWPEPTYSEKGGADLFGDHQKWKASRSIIDFGIPSKSIYGRKKPLAKNTLKRIEAGLRKYSGLPFVLGQQSCASPRSVDNPLPTVSAAGAISLVEPFLITTNWGETNRSQPRSVEDPMPTITGQNFVGLVQPFIVQMDLGGSSHSVDEPMNTLTSADARGLFVNFIRGGFFTGLRLPGC